MLTKIQQNNERSLQSATSETKLPQCEQQSRPPSRNTSQTNQSGRDKDLLCLQAQVESLKSKKQQLNNQNYTNQHSHLKKSIPASHSGSQTVMACIEKTMKSWRNFGEQLKNQFNINATHKEMQ